MSEKVDQAGRGWKRPEINDLEIKSTGSFRKFLSGIEEYLSKFCTRQEKPMHRPENCYASAVQTRFHFSGLNSDKNFVKLGTCNVQQKGPLGTSLLFGFLDLVPALVYYLVELH